MNGKRESSTPAEMKALVARVERWRRLEGGRGARVPEELWKLAAEVARTQGVYATARALRLNYVRLQKRVGSTKATGGALRKARVKHANETQPAFIDLGTAALGSGHKMVIELEGRSGERLRMDVTGGNSADVVGLAQMFWSLRK